MWPSYIITVRDSSCGKVVFSQVCVKNSAHGGHAWGGGMCDGGVCMVRVCVAGETATAADGTLLECILVIHKCDFFKKRSLEVKTRGSVTYILYFKVTI